MSKVIVLSGYGVNCEEETKKVFEIAGAVQVDVVHINDLISNQFKLSDYQILVFPGGFSFGDDLGAGKAFANLFKLNLEKEIQNFIEAGKLIIGICNGFQILTNLDLLPGNLLHNSGGIYIDRWVDLKVNPQNNSPWLEGISELSIPIAHGEGNYFAKEDSLADLELNNQVAFQYMEGQICKRQKLAANPNGSVQNIAGITSKSGNILGMMPHPERAVYFTQLCDWTVQKEQLLREGKTLEDLPNYTSVLKLFKNAVKYIQKEFYSHA